MTEETGDDSLLTLMTSVAAKHLLLQQVLDAIDTGRSEPLFAIRDAIRVHLAEGAQPWGSPANDTFDAIDQALDGPAYDPMCITDADIADYTTRPKASGTNAREFVLGGAYIGAGAAEPADEFQSLIWPAFRRALRQGLTSWQCDVAMEAAKAEGERQVGNLSIPAAIAAIVGAAFAAVSDEMQKEPE